ncbi:MAG: PQQ-binding-like beta-propeller repeat protein, partial [Planctomycetota bacterium]
MMKTKRVTVLFQIVMCLLACCTVANADENWLQLKGDGQRSGNVPEITLKTPLSLAAAIPLTDGIYTSPVVSHGKVFVIDGSGVVFAIDATNNQVLWKFATRGGAGNCNNVATPAVIDQYLHVGTAAGYYYVLDLNTGAVVKEIDCREPIFSAPVVNGNRVYFATLGAQVYAVEPKGEVVWTWDFVKEVVQFNGNRWSGADWLAHRKDRVTWRDHFVCSRDICLAGNTIVIPAGGRTVFLDDAGKTPRLRAVGEVPNYAGSEFPATFGQSADEKGNVYVQWHRRDNAGRVEIMRLEGDKVQTDFIKGT